MKSQLIHIIIKILGRYSWPWHLESWLSIICIPSAHVIFSIHFMCRSDCILKILTIEVIEHNAYTNITSLSPVIIYWLYSYQPYPLIQVSTLTEKLRFLPLSYHSATIVSISASVGDGMYIACGRRCLTNAIISFSSETLFI